MVRVEPMAAIDQTQALEEARLNALRRTGLLDSPPAQFFDLITAMAAKALSVPVVLMSLVDSDRQFFKANAACRSRGRKSAKLPSPILFASSSPC